MQLDDNSVKEILHFPIDNVLLSLWHFRFSASDSPLTGPLFAYQSVYKDLAVM